MKFQITIKGDTIAEPVEMVIIAEDKYDARIKALRKYFENRRICMFSAYNPLPGQGPSGQAGYGYERAARSSGCEFACATPLVRVLMVQFP